MQHNRTLVNTCFYVDSIDMNLGGTFLSWRSGVKSSDKTFGVSNPSFKIHGKGIVSEIVVSLNVDNVRKYFSVANGAFTISRTISAGRCTVTICKFSIVVVRNSVNG